MDMCKKARNTELFVINHLSHVELLSILQNSRQPSLTMFLSCFINYLIAF